MSTGDPRFRKTKIVATLGPGSDDASTISRLVEAGVNVFRINSSHGTNKQRVELMKLVHEARDRTECYPGLLLDLQGPRIRVGKLPEPLELVEGAQVRFVPDSVSSLGERDIPTTYHDLAADVEPGQRVLLDDGLLSVEVVDVEADVVVGKVLYGGRLRSSKGINLPRVRVSAPSVTEKDEEDIRLGLEHGVDFLGVSFVRRAEDVESVRELVPESVKLVAKIEKAEALGDLENIIYASDAVMVARGDLGVEMPFEEVPLAQKHVIGMANKLGRPVITATQMLESMIHSPRPTRAEASDVANAILDGTDAVMLSAETAVGDYPVQAVEAMVRIINEIERAEHDPRERRRRDPDRISPTVGEAVEDAIALATCEAAEMLKVPLIVCFTKSGFTARKISTFRPSTPIVGLSTEAATCRQLSIVWGVVPELARHAPDYEGMLDCAREVLENKRYVKKGDRIAVTAGVPFDVPGTTNLLKVEVA